MRNLLMAHRHVPSRQELLSRPRNIPGYQEWKNSATPRACRSCGVTGSASVSRSPKASALQFRGSKQRTGRLLPALAIQGTARHGKHMYPPPLGNLPFRPPADALLASASSHFKHNPPRDRSIGCLLPFPCAISLPRSIHLFFTPRHCPVRELHTSFPSERAIASRKLQPKYTSTFR